MNKITFREKMGRPAKVALILHELLFGGTQKQTIELAKNLDRDRFTPEIWKLCKGTDFQDEILENKITLVSLGNCRKVGPWTLKRLYFQIRRTKPDIMLLLTVVPNIWGRIFGKRLDVPVIIGTLRSGDCDERQYERWLWDKADHFIGNSKAMADKIMRYGVREDQITTVINGLDPGFFCPPTEEKDPTKKIVLCVARLAPDKNHPTLVEAFKQVAAANPDAELWIVGNGPDHSYINRLVMHSGVSDRIKMFPGTRNPVPFYQQASILVLSSVKEGLPNAVLEGMSCGLPVVSTNVGGLPEVIVDGETGLLVPPRNPTELAKGINTLLSQKDLCERMGRAGRQRVIENYSIRRMVEQHEELFERLLAKRF